MLDVATGTGWTARRAAARGAAVIGVDLGPDLIKAAKAEAAEAGLTIDFRVGDAEQLPFDDGNFDAVTSTCGVLFVRDPEATAAVTTPGGWRLTDSFRVTEIPGGERASGGKGNSCGRKKNGPNQDDPHKTPRCGRA